MLYLIQVFLVTLAMQHTSLYRLSHLKPREFLPAFVPLCFLMYRRNKQCCNLFYRDTLQIAFALYGIISRYEQLLMQEEGGDLYFVLWHSNVEELLRDGEKSNVTTRITVHGASEKVTLDRRYVFGLITRR